MKIAIVTGSRAEYGLLEPLIKLVWESDDYLDLIVTGSHLSDMTVDQIQFPISERIECVLASDSETSVCKSIGLAVMGFGSAFERFNPDVVVLLGDRYEILAAAIAAHIHRTPIAHLHGGEVTEGATDDAWRHSITKMASLHFTSTDEYQNRVIQLGENPETVFNVGALGTQGLKRRSKQPISGQAVVVYHPETLLACETKVFYDIIDAVIESGIKPIFIKPNSDNGSDAISDVIDCYKEYAIFTSLDRDDYLNLLKESDFIIGNSSSGIIEAPELGVPTIDIGKRQGGRIRASSVIDIPDPEYDLIRAAIMHLYSGQFQAELSDIKTPHRSNCDTAQTIFDIIKSEVPYVDLRKGFHDLAS